MGGDSISEEGALSLLCEALGGLRYQRTGEDSTKADGFIVLADGGEVEIDVARDLSERFMSKVAQAARLGGTIKLSPGTGSWDALFDSRTDIKTLHQNAQGIIDGLVASGRVTRSGDSVTLNRLRDGTWLDTIQKVGDSPDQLTFRIHEFLNETNSFMDTSPDAIRNYAQNYIDGAGGPRSRGHRGAKFENLARRAKENGRQAHFALIANFPKNIGVWHALTQLMIGPEWNYEFPKEPLEMPDGIQGFWVLYPNLRITVAYLENQGWIRYPS